jgi:hypothetical protein
MDMLAYTNRRLHHVENNGVVLRCKTDQADKSSARMALSHVIDAPRTRPLVLTVTTSVPPVRTLYKRPRDIDKGHLREQSPSKIGCNQSTGNRILTQKPSQ